MLPISNPANLVIYGSRMPPLLQWLPAYLLPSLVAIVATYLLLRFTQRSALDQYIAKEVPRPALTAAGKMAAVGIAATAIVLLTSSALDLQLGLPTAVAGSLTAIAVLIRERKSPWSIVKDISWGVLPLVAGLFVLVEALGKTGLIDAIAALLRDGEQHAALLTAALSGIAIALASNLINNLPAGLIGGERRANRASRRARHARDPDRRRSRAQSVGDRLARHHPVARRFAPRRPFGRLRRVPENRRGGDAAGAYSRDCSRIAARPERDSRRRSNGWRVGGVPPMVGALRSQAGWRRREERDWSEPRRLRVELCQRPRN